MKQLVISKAFTDNARTQRAELMAHAKVGFETERWLHMNEQVFLQLSNGQLASADQSDAGIRCTC